MSSPRRRGSSAVASATARDSPGAVEIRTYWVYILASQRNGTLYIGVTSDLCRRIWEHREGIFPGFTKKYDVHKLVWCEAFNNIEDAITCEKRMKKWNRSWKLRLIEKTNPEWKDLSQSFTG